MNRGKEIVRSVFALTVVLAVFWLCRQSFLANDTNEGRAGFLGFLRASDGASHLDDGESGRDFGGYEDSEEHEWYRQYEDILAMPTCGDLRNSIEKLRDARTRLLEAAVKQDTQAMLIAAAEYREAVQKIRSGFTAFRMRVAPDDFPYASQELLGYYAPDEGESLLPCELGPFAEDIYQ